MKRISVVLGVLLLLVGWAGGARAISMAELLNEGSITAGDKLFDSWSLKFYDASDGRQFNAANILVTALEDGGLDPGPGLRFEVINAELDVTGDGGYAFVDLMFGFRVSVLDQMLRIKDNSLELSDGFLNYTDDGETDLGFYVRETVGSATGLNDLGVKETQFSVLNGELTSQVFASAAFDPRSEIWVTKNILVWAVDDDTDTASLLGLEQRFSQAQGVIPEPGTMLLLGSGLAGLAAWRRRRV